VSKTLTVPPFLEASGTKPTGQDAENRKNMKRISAGLAPQPNASTPLRHSASTWHFTPDERQPAAFPIHAQPFRTIPRIENIFSHKHFLAFQLGLPSLGV
jgi:hypothetical protein